MASKDTEIKIEIDEYANNGIISVKITLESSKKTSSEKVELFARNPTGLVRLETYEFHDGFIKIQSASSFRLPSDFFVNNHYEIHYGNKLIRIPQQMQSNPVYKDNQKVSNNRAKLDVVLGYLRRTLYTIIPIILFALFLVLAQISISQFMITLSRVFMVAALVILLYLITLFLNRQKEVSQEATVEK